MSKCPVCQKNGTHTCTGCRQVDYCCKEHQRDHWKQHKIQCRPFQVERNAELGRHLVAKRDIPEGFCVISETPLVLGPKIDSEPLCLGCYRPLDPETSSRCGGCEWPCCDPHCPGLTSQDHHLPECIVLSKNLQPARIGQFNYDAILPLRCLILQKKSAKKWKQLISMDSHITERNETTEIYKEIEEKISKYLCDNYLSQLEVGVLQNISSAIIHVICGIIEVNSIEITIDEEEITALYPTACLMEHNCMPNVKFSFNLEDFKINVYTVDDLKQGTHICTMYTHTLWGTAARREHLNRTKYFTCKCTRCNDPTELGTNFSTLKCLGNSVNDVTETCGGDILAMNGEEDSDWTCTACPLILSSAHVTDLVSRLGAQVDAVMEAPSVKKLETLLVTLEKVLHKNHYHCFTVAHSLVQLWGREVAYPQLPQSVLQRKIELCRRLTGLARMVDPTSTRTGLYTSVALLEEHSALVEGARRAPKDVHKDQLLTEANNCLQEARRIVDTIGPGTKLLSVINSASRSVERELDKFKIIEIT